MRPALLPVVVMLLAAGAASSAGQGDDALAERRLRLYRREMGKLSPKSVVASRRGDVFAQNMIYKHTVTMFDSDGERLADIPDLIPRSMLGLNEPPAPSITVKGKPYVPMVRGAPVEAAVTNDGKTLYVSNYYILGKGFPGNVTDRCDMDKKLPSYVYQIDVDSRRVIRTFQTGSTPKFLALTPDEKQLIVSNWCSHSVSIIDLRGDAPTVHVKVASFPRGIAITDDGGTAYIASMGRHQIDVVDLKRGAVVATLKPGRGPRHVLIEKSGDLLVTLSHESAVVRVDPLSGEIVSRVRTGTDPRSMALSDDGTAAYVVNYREASMSVIDLRTMHVVQKVGTGPFPVGVAYEPTKERVWVSCYGGSVRLYDTRGAAPHDSVRYVDPEELRRFSMRTIKPDTKKPDTKRAQ